MNSILTVLLIYKLIINQLYDNMCFQEFMYLTFSSCIIPETNFSSISGGNEDFFGS